MSLREGLGFGRLSPQTQQAYRILSRAFEAYSTEIDASSLPPNADIMGLALTVLGDNPSIVYFDKTQIKSTASMFKKKYQLVGCQGRAQGAQLTAAVTQKAAEIAASIQRETTDPYERIVKVYEYLQANVVYNRAELQACMKGGRSTDPSTHNAYGALMKSSAVCDGFSSAFCLISQQLGFECMSVNGKSSHRSAGFADHSWNIIKLNNRFYHLDVTWDTNQSKELGVSSFDYFLIDDDEISTDHEWDINSTPTCSYTDMNYYIRNGCYANNMSQAESFIRNAISTRTNPVRIKMSQSVALSDKPDETLAHLVVDTLINSGKDAQINYSWNEKTRCFFAVYA